MKVPIEKFEPTLLALYESVIGEKVEVGKEVFFALNDQTTNMVVTEKARMVADMLTAQFAMVAAAAGGE